MVFAFMFPNREWLVLYTFRIKIFTWPPFHAIQRSDFSFVFLVATQPLMPVGEVNPPGTRWVVRAYCNNLAI